MDEIKIFLLSLLNSPLLMEMMFRTFCVLLPAEGLRIILRALLYTRYSKKKAKMYSEQFGFLANISIGILASYAYAEDRETFIIIYQGIAYGLATVAIHWTWVKNDLGSKILKGIKTFVPWLLRTVIPWIKKK